MAKKTSSTKPLASRTYRQQHSAGLSSQHGSNQSAVESMHSITESEKAFNEFTDFLTTTPTKTKNDEKKDTTTTSAVSPLASAGATRLDMLKGDDDCGSTANNSAVKAAAITHVTTMTTRSSSDDALEKGVPLYDETERLQSINDDENDDDKESRCSKLMHFLSTLLFVIGSVLYLIMAVKDYQWANTLLTLPMWLRSVDDDISWQNYRIEERYKASLLGDAGGGGGGVRRMKTRELWMLQEEEMKEIRGVVNDEEGDTAKVVIEPYPLSIEDEDERHQGSSNAEVLEVSAVKGESKTDSASHRKLQDTPDPSIYEDECWVDLPPVIQAAYATLGYDEELWELEGVITEWDDYDWWELPTAQKEAATFLGYNEESWCEGSCDLLEADITARPTTPSPSKSPTNRPTPNPTTVNPITPSPTRQPTIKPVTPTPVTQAPSTDKTVADSPINISEELNNLFSSESSTPEESSQEIEYWDDLPSKTQIVYTAIGFDKVLWDSGGTVPVNTKSWSDMNIYERIGLTSLGWDKESWDETPTGEHFPSQPKAFVEEEDSLPESASPTPMPITPSPTTRSPTPAPSTARPTTVEPTTQAPVPQTSSTTATGETAGTTEDVVPVCPCVELYEDEWWRDLPPDIQQLYGVLGYNEALWDGGIEEAPSDDLYWSELSAEEQKAALILGYTQEIWDAEDVAFELLAQSPSNSTMSWPSTNTESNTTNVSPIPAGGIEAGFYDDYDWEELPKHAQEAATTLGYSLKTWDMDGVAFSDNFYWDELSDELKEAAALLGYNKELWDKEDLASAYISYDDDYIIQVGTSDVWISEYQIYYFFASLSFVFVGLFDLIRERRIFHLLMILAGLFGVVSAVYVEEDIHLSNVFNCISVSLFLCEGITLFGAHKRSALTSGAAKWMKRAVMLGDFEFIVGALLDVILSFFYLFDNTADWDTSLMIVGIFAAVLWLHCSLIYLGGFTYSFFKKESFDW